MGEHGLGQGTPALAEGAEADDEQELRAFAAQDPVVTTGTGTIEVGKMLAGFVRPRPDR
jgi:hypothetical protein